MNTPELRIFVDDERAAPEGWYLLKSWQEASVILQILKEFNVTLDKLSLDHDLGIDPATGDDLTTRPLVLWMCENNWWPREVYVHTGNPVAEEWLVGTIRRYSPEGTLAGYGSNYWATDNTTVCRDSWD